MALLSFGNHPSGLTPELGEFWKLIPQKIKVRTCRSPRVRPIKVGETLHIYWKVRKKKELKPVHHLGTATCKSMTRIFYGDFYDNEIFAKEEGFESLEELHKWFGNVNEDIFCLYNLYDAIYWGDTFKPSTELIEALKKEGIEI